MPYIFGPVPSRRLGLSLGVDLIPSKTCTYDCLYCQMGRTTNKTLERRSYFPVQEVLLELNRRLRETTPDMITLSGSGEPTLHREIGRIISSVRDVSAIPLAVLTNGSLVWKEEVRKGLCNASIIMPTLTSSRNETFRAIHRPCPALHVGMIIKGLKDLRRVYRGQIFLEIMLLAGFNDSDGELEGLRQVISEISPDKIHLNTVVRPPSDLSARCLDTKHLEEIKSFLGHKAEIVAGFAANHSKRTTDSFLTYVTEAAKRRPLRVLDIANAMNMDMNDAESLIKGLVIKGHLREQRHSGEIYYVTTANGSSDFS
jgi:wyosine [tRNA(Phe)-imidazoG37] synthetase (radical SAM superfamily)